MKKAIFIVGPTAVGKTALAVKLHKKIPSILISADSIQVYRGADIISGKDHSNDTLIELIDILPPKKSFSVAEFVDKVRKIVAKSNKIPVIVGGTGLYTKALFENIETINVRPNKILRKKLSKFSVKDLQKELKKLDLKKFESMNDSDINNPRRLARAIEIVSSSSKNQKSEPVFNEKETLIIGLKTTTENLKKRIKKRVDERIKIGALEEAKKLFANYKKLSPQLKVANGYKQMFEFLQNKITWEEAVERWGIADLRHAKAQMTYFKKMNVEWFDAGKKGNEFKILRLISKELSL